MSITAFLFFFLTTEKKERKKKTKCGVETPVQTQTTVWMKSIFLYFLQKKAKILFLPIVYVSLKCATLSVY